MIRNAIQRFMYGRYGNDPLNLFLMGLYLLLYLVFMFTRVELLYIISFVLLFATLFRLLSRNMERRRAENALFMRAANPVLQWLRLRRTKQPDKEHVYIKIPTSGQPHPVPPGRGRNTRTSRSCGASFQEKS